MPLPIDWSVSAVMTRCPSTAPGVAMAAMPIGGLSGKSGMAAWAAGNEAANWRAMFITFVRFMSPTICAPAGKRDVTLATCGSFDQAGLLGFNEIDASLESIGRGVGDHERVLVGRSDVIFHFTIWAEH